MAVATSKNCCFLPSHWDIIAVCKAGLFKYRANVGNLLPFFRLRKDQYLYIWNMKPERWPAGAPQRLIPDSTEGTLYPMYGIDSAGAHHSDWAFTDIDAAPTKSFIVEHRNEEEYEKYFELVVGKHPEYELFDIEKDPTCLNILPNNPEFTGIMDQMEEIMLQELKTTEDSRVVGPNKKLFDTYPRYSPMREFPKPD